MNTPANDFPFDDKMSAWLDGELTPAQGAEVEAWLRDHPEDAARARLWAADRDALRARLGPVIEEPMPERLAQLAWNHVAGTAPGSWSLAAACVAGLTIFALGAALGSGATWRWLGKEGKDTEAQSLSAGRGSEEGWERRALVAHAVFAPEVRHPVEVAVAAATPEGSRAQEEHLARWLTKRIDRPVKLFDLRAQGFELVGGRLLPDGDGPCAQLMYQRIGQGAGTRLTVYLRKPDSAVPAAFRYVRDGGLGMFYWVEGTTVYALVGDLPREELLTLAEAIYKQS